MFHVLRLDIFYQLKSYNEVWYIYENNINIS